MLLRMPHIRRPAFELSKLILNYTNKLNAILQMKAIYNVTRFDLRKLSFTVMTKYADL